MLTVAVYSRDRLRPLADLAEFAKDAGLSHVQVAWEQIARASPGAGGLQPGPAGGFPGGPKRGRSPGHGPIYAENPSVDSVVERLRDAGLEIVGLDATTLDGLDDETFEKQTDDICTQMRTAGRIGAECVTVTAGPRDPANFTHVVDGLRRLTVLADRVGVGISIRNLCDSGIEQLEDVHRLFHGVGAASMTDVDAESPIDGGAASLTNGGAESLTDVGAASPTDVSATALTGVSAAVLTLDLDMTEFQRAVVNPHDAAISFPGRVARVRAGDVNLQSTLSALTADGFAGPVLAAVEDGLTAAHRVIKTVRSI